MTKPTWRRFRVAAVLSGGFLFAGPCGITTLQTRDFLTSAITRTVVTTLASILEAATIQEAQQGADGGG